MAKDNHSETTSRFTRRGFLGGIGAGAIGAAGAIANPEPGVAQQFPQTTTDARPDRFSRMFDGLQPFADASLRVQSALRELGAKGGLLDAQDQSERRTGSADRESGVERQQSRQSRDDGRRDVLRAVSRSRHDVRRPRPDSACRHGLSDRRTRGRRASISTRSMGADRSPTPHLYDPGRSRQVQDREDHGRRFRRSSAHVHGAAIIPDPRNDEHVIIAGMQAAFLCFHNRVVDMLRASGDDQRLSLRDDDEAEDASTAADADAFDDFRRAPGCATCSPKRAGWSPGTTSGSSSTSSCRASSAPRWSTTSWREAGASTGREPERRAFRSNSRWPIGSGTASCGRRIAPTSPATAASRSSRSSSIPAGQGQTDPVDLRGGARAAAALHRLADVLQLRRRLRRPTSVRTS